MFINVGVIKTKNKTKEQASSLNVQEPNDKDLTLYLITTTKDFNVFKML